LVNSMFAMQLILFIEKEFGLTVASDELELRNFSSIDAMCAFITGKHCA
jgi:methoxymalonate biosynthesis acyl carrier protein